MKKDELPKGYQLPNDVLPKISVSEPELDVQILIKETTGKIKERINKAVSDICIAVHVDPDILRRQSDELKKQAEYLKVYSNLRASGKLKIFPAALGQKVFLVEGERIYCARVIRYEQSLSPQRNLELSFVDLDIYSEDIIVRRSCMEFGRHLFLNEFEARAARKSK